MPSASPSVFAIFADEAQPALDAGPRAAADGADADDGTSPERTSSSPKMQPHEFAAARADETGQSEDFAPM